MNYTRYKGFIHVLEIKFKELDKIKFISNDKGSSIEEVYNEYKPDVFMNIGLNDLTSESILTKDKLKKICNMECCIKGYPRLIKNNKKCRIILNDGLSYKYVNGKLPRTAIGHNKKSLFLIFVDSPGIGLSELTEFMYSTLLCTDGINVNTDTHQIVKTNRNKITKINKNNNAINTIIAIYEMQKIDTRFKRQISTHKPDGTTTRMIYEVKEKDTLLSVGKKLNVDCRELVQKNNLEAPFELRKGQKLVYDKWTLYC
jgi:hypothetical protein